jgi:predicted metalloprotease with PDZ domain
VQSLGDSSFDAWIKFYRRDENSPNATVSYYVKGALVALALDLTLRSSRTSLDDLMRRSGSVMGRRASASPKRESKRSRSSSPASHLTDFFARYIDGTEDPPLEALLAQVGVTYRLRPAEAIPTVAAIAAARRAMTSLRRAGFGASRGGRRGAGAAARVQRWSGRTGGPCGR